MLWEINTASLALKGPRWPLANAAVTLSRAAEGRKLTFAFFQPPENLESQKTVMIFQGSLAFLMDVLRKTECESAFSFLSLAASGHLWASSALL